MTPTALFNKNLGKVLDISTVCNTMISKHPRVRRCSETLQIFYSGSSLKFMDFLSFYGIVSFKLGHNW